MSKYINQVIQKAIDLTGGTQVSLAKKAGLSQNAIWKLLTGVTKKPSYQTSLLLEEAVDRQISRLEFMDSEAVELKESYCQLEIDPVSKVDANTAG